VFACEPSDSERSSRKREPVRGGIGDEIGESEPKVAPPSETRRSAERGEKKVENFQASSKCDVKSCV
jgi:hypothetical protein